ncbi:LysR family transcriptional regulator [Amycolatopsis sp. FDAARGOS 1241]|nr:LysR family transcriptional regulator [Amycolatopsis sp. FDAARGOS 1241]
MVVRGSQPSPSHAIRALERDLGQALFHHVGLTAPARP